MVSILHQCQKLLQIIISFQLCISICSENIFFSKLLSNAVNCLILKDKMLSSIQIFCYWQYLIEFYWLFNNYFWLFSFECITKIFHETLLALLMSSQNQAFFDYMQKINKVCFKYTNKSANYIILLLFFYFLFV